MDIDVFAGVGVVLLFVKKYLRTRFGTWVNYNDTVVQKLGDTHCILCTWVWQGCTFFLPHNVLHVIIRWDEARKFKTLRVQSPHCSRHNAMKLQSA